MSRPHRVFIGLTEVAGYYRGLERGLREIGVDARFFDLSANPSRYGPRTATSRLKGPATRIAAHARSPGTPGWWVWRAASLAHRAWKAAMRLVLLPWALLRYDTFIFHGLDSFAGYRDLAVLKRLGKRVIFVFNGSDHRPPYLNGKWVRYAERTGWERIARDSRVFRRRVATVERYADAIIALSSSAQFHRRPFVHFLAIGLPFDAPGTHARLRDGGDSHAIRLLHSPSDPDSKGTREFRDAVATLRDRGYNLDYREIVGQPNDVVLSAIAEADVVLDELYSDTPMAGLATEAAFLGTPTLACGYYADYVSDDLDPALVPPTLFCHPDSMLQALERLVTDERYREELGAAARKYVEGRWTPASVAARVLRVIQGDVPKEWLYDPANIRYVGGWGLPEAMLRDGLRALVETAGRDSLQMRDRPDLERRLLALAGQA